MGDHKEEEVSTSVAEFESASKTISTLTEQQLDGNDSITQPQPLDASDKRENDSLGHSYPYSNDVTNGMSIEDSVKEGEDTSDPDAIISTPNVVERTCDEQTQNPDQDALHTTHYSPELTKADQSVPKSEAMSSSDISTGSNDHSPSHPVPLNQSDTSSPAMISESGDQSSVAVKDSTQSIEQRMDSEASIPSTVSGGSDGKQLQDSGDVYSTVVSLQTSRSTLSPLNTLSLEEEMEHISEPEEVVEGQASDENEGKSHLLKSAGIRLCSESSTSEEPQDGDDMKKLPPPSPKSIRGKPLPVVYDRSLEQFSEVLLDSDISFSDDEPQNTLSENATKLRVEKRVRFADEVVDASTVNNQTENSAGSGTGVSSQGGRTPPHLPNLFSGSGKHPGVPVSPSPTSPKTPVGQLPSPRHASDELIEGVEYSAEYLGSTPIILSGSASNKTARMYQAQQAVKLIKDPENESQPRFSVKVKISTVGIKIADSQSNIDLMDHPLRTISYIADIDNALVIMANRGPPPTQGSGAESPGHIPRLTCHVLETADARHVALVIGQAFSVAYQEFLRANGISEEALEEAEYIHVLNAQSVPQTEVESLTDRNKTKKLTLAKHKGEIMGIMVMESGYGSAIPTCIIAHMSKNGAAMKSGQLNVGDHIIVLNGVSLVGMPLKACVEQIKKCRYRNVVKMVVCSCPAAVDVTIVRPDVKFQLGFTVQDGVIVSLIRGTIAERSGIRVGHCIIEINGTSTVGVEHADVVHLLSTTVGDNMYGDQDGTTPGCSCSCPLTGDLTSSACVCGCVVNGLHIRTMPSLMYRLITGQATPEYS